MAQKGLKYEYKLLTFADEATEAEVQATLNELGLEGWWVISVSHGTHFDEQAWGTCWLVRVI